MPAILPALRDLSVIEREPQLHDRASIFIM